MECEMEDEEEDGEIDSPLMIVTEEQYSARTITCSRKQYQIATVILSLLCILFAGLTIFLLVQENVHSRHSKEKDSDDQGLAFFQISDTHLDVYYNSSISSDNYRMCRDLKKRNVSRNGIKTSSTTSIPATFGRVKCDTPMELLESAADKINDENKNLNKPAEFVIVSGDQSAHDYDYFQVDAYKSIMWSIVNSTQILSDKSNLPILVAIGNNDLPEDYRPPTKVHPIFYKSLGDLLKRFIFLKGTKTASLNSDDVFERTFNYGGYYSVNVAENLMVILLNTNYWNSKAYRLNTNTSIIGDSQMIWFKFQLSAARAIGKNVIICGHIPPGVSTYKDEGSFWLTNYTKLYVETVNEYTDLLSGQIFGHVHEDKIKIQQPVDNFHPTRNTPSESYLLMCPGITPIYGNNPAFRMFSMDHGNKLKDYAQYFMDITIANVHRQPTWQLEYRFSKLYSNYLSSESINDVVENLISGNGNSTWYSYSSHMKSLYGGITTKLMFREYCSARHVSNKAYRDCLNYYEGVL